MYKKVWKHFLAEAVESTFDLDQTHTKPRSTYHRGLGAYLFEQGFYIDEYLGGGKDGEVYRATDKKTGQRVAVKIISASPTRVGTNADREVENYEFVRLNRDSLGDEAKYLPVVYSAKMDEIPLQGEPMDGEKGLFGVIFMEELEPLPSSIARGLFVPSRPRPRADARTKTARDKRLFKDPSTIEALLTLAISLLRDNTLDFFNWDVEAQAIKETKRRFYGSEAHKPDAHQKKFMSPQGARLMDFFAEEAVKAMVENQENDEATRLVKDYEDSVKRELQDSFFKAYNRPIVSGGADLQIKSGLKGLGQLYGQEKEIEKAFPESAGIRAAMKKFLGRGLRAFDVHSDNVMMRPATNDIVIVDLGRFEVRA
mgnify:CR=1 FL=1